MASRERPRLLVVDDEPEITSTFKTILGSEGYEVVTASDGVEALEAIRRERFSVILLDLLLPRLDGWAVLEQLREIAPTTRAVILCADVDSEGEIAAFRLGAVNILLKPPDVDKLLRLVDDLTRPEDQPPPGR
jgi:two-component system, OmpR family, response regulator MprA